MTVERTELIEVVRHLVRALDEVVLDLESLGRTPTAIRHSIAELRDIEYRLMSEPEPGAQILI